MNQSQTRIHAYHSDPVVAAIVDTLLRESLSSPFYNRHETTMLHAAKDFFVLGGAMVAHPSLTSQCNLLQEMFSIQEDGTAIYNGPLPPSYEGRRTLQSEEYLLLAVPEGLEFPEEEEDLQPWVDAWKVEEAKLASFLA